MIYCMDAAENERLPTKLSELENNFSELSENIVNLEKDMKKLIQYIKLSTYTTVESIDNE